MKLSHRLKGCLDFVKGFEVLYDIGTDHALLPIEAIKLHYLTKAYAVDNKIGPLNQAKKNIAAHGLTQQILPILSSGIDDLAEDADVCVMAGIGGHQIYHAFSTGDTKNLKRFVFQPTVNPQAVRKLTEHHFMIIDEVILEEAHQSHIIIVMERGAMVLDSKAIAFGPVLLKTQPLLYKNALVREKDYLTTLLTDVSPIDAREKLLSRVKAIEEVLYEWHRS